MKFKVVLNGTNHNPYEKFGLSQNPFPQVAKYEYTPLMKLQKLGGTPIPNIQYIRETLVGFSDEFVDLCCSRFKLGEMVEFEVVYGKKNV